MRRLFPLFFALLSLFAGSARAEIIDIDNDQLAILQASGVPLIDVRTEGEWRDTGIVPGSRLLTFFNERGQANPGAWLERARAIATPDKPVAVICRSGNRTQAVSRFLSEQAGYRTVYNVKQGINQWLREGRTTAPAAPQLANCQAGKAC